MAKEVAIVGGGCFWCIEAVYSKTKGVISALSGYAGGNEKLADYRSVCSGTTGHAEVVEVTFDNDIISYKEILEILFNIHDPTTLNRQGADAGTQYRSVIFYTSEAQKEIANAVMQSMQSYFTDPIVTELSPAPTFFVAEDYHQNYFALNPTQGYCQAVIAPKVQKFMTHYKDKLKV